MIIDLTETQRWLKSLRDSGGPDLTQAAHKKMRDEAQEVADEPENMRN